jgi:thiamine biosynthesis lipoprotein
LLLAVAAAVPAFGETVKESQPLMGGIVDISVESSDRDHGHELIREAVAAGQKLQSELAADDESSDLSKLNAAAGLAPIAVPLDLYRLLALSQLMTRSTGSAFDVTIGPLVRNRRTISGSDHGPHFTFDQALSLVGADKIVLKSGKAGLAKAGMSVDVSAVERGYCLERMAAVLRKAGVTKALLQFDDTAVLAIGPPAGEPPFRIWIARGKSMAGSLLLRDRSVATTRVRQRGNGSSSAPIVDPRSGRFVEADRQATVLARDAAIAQAWSTALVVDPDGALGLLDEPRDVEAVTFDERGAHTSPHFIAESQWVALAGAPDFPESDPVPPPQPPEERD